MLHGAKHSIMMHRLYTLCMFLLKWVLTGLNKAKGTLQQK